MEKGSSSSSSSSSAAAAGGSDSFNGLKFGKKIYFEGVGSGLQPRHGGGAAAPTSPAKKGRTGLAQGGQPPKCQVEGCHVDLSDAKAYYSRHKVCGMHSKSPKVIVGGLEQRFCQQCSRSAFVVPLFYTFFFFQNYKRKSIFVVVVVYLNCLCWFCEV